MTPPPVVLVAAARPDALGGQVKFGHVLLAALRELGPAEHVDVPLHGEVSALGRIATSFALAWRVAAAVRRAGGRPVVHLFSPTNRTGFYEKLGLAVVARLAGGRPVLNFRSALDESVERWTALEQTAVRMLLPRFWVLTQHERLSERLVGNGYAREVTCAALPNALAEDELRALRTVADARPEGGVAKVFLHLGSTDPRKGLDTLVRAATLARKELGPGRFRLHVHARSPSGVRMERLRGMVAAAGGDEIVVADPVTGPDKLEALAHADAFVLPSESEGFPNALLEAMAAGLAPLASRVGAVPDMVLEGESGLLFDAGDAEALAKLMVRLVGEPELVSRLGRAAAERVRTEYRIEDVVSRYHEFYDRVRGD